MRFFAFLFIILVLLVPDAAQACRPLIHPDEEAQKFIDEAYFVGMVKGIYIQQDSKGFLKEAGFEPFAVYSAAPDADLRNPIVVVEKNWTSCSASAPARYEFAEVMVIRQDGQLQLRRLNFATSEFKNKLRQKVRYVGKNN